jgi:hypothetical protein
MAKQTKSTRGLVENAFTTLPLGSIRPAGWLSTQLRIQAAGLTGHLDEFWPDNADSAWIGGKSEGCELRLSVRSLARLRTPQGNDTVQ